MVRRNSSSEFRVINVSVGVFVAIAYLTISNGSSDFGGGVGDAGVFALDSSADFFRKIRQPRITTVKGEDSTVSVEATVMVRNCTFTGNQAANGGAISNHGGTVILSSSSFSGNVGKILAAGVENAELGTAQVRNTIIACERTDESSARCVPLWIHSTP